MKVSIDGILGSANRIKGQRQLEEENLDSRKNQVRADSVSISSRISSRIDTIEAELREIQSSLTRNQIIRDGIGQLQNDLARGGVNQQSILNDVQFEGDRVLRHFVGDSITESLLTNKAATNRDMISTDVDRLKRLQIELDNMGASNLAGSDRVQTLMQNMESVFSNAGIVNLEGISSLRPDAVMRLIR